MSPFGQTSQLTWKQADGSAALGRIIRISRLSVAFELLDPYLVLRTSEVLSHLEISLEGERAYSGRAVVTSILNTGNESLCEVCLEAPGLLPQLPPGNWSAASLATSYSSFCASRAAIYKIGSEFKLAVLDVEMFLSDLRRWLEHLEAKLRSTDSEGDSTRHQSIVETLAPSIIADFNLRHERWEQLADRIDPQHRWVHQEFVRQLWQPLFVSNPFGWRATNKPLGYPGDYEMMNMIHRKAPEGNSLFAKMIHFLLVHQWPAESVRNRIAHLQEQIITESARAVRARRRVKILNIGCGPAWEMQEIIRNHELSNFIDLTLLDFDAETLDYAQNKLVTLSQEFSRTTNVHIHKVSVQQLLIRAQKGKAAMSTKFDLVYCGGLFDYLSANTCRALVRLMWEIVSPEGLAVIANMNDCQPFRHFIEFVLDWNLIYRTGQEMIAFCCDELREHATTVAEPTSVNVFLHLRKPV